MIPTLKPSEFVALLNQTLEFSYPQVEIEGEVINFKVSKNRWVYFDIADENAKLRCFGTVYMLPAPVEDGMKVRITASPRLHPLYNFSLNLQTLQFSGEGSIKKAADLLAAQLEKEGLFAPERKRILPYPPDKIALITSADSAAYKDFEKVLSARYGGIEIELADVQVQGENTPGQVVRAIEWFNKQANIADVMVIIRGGGSADDLQAFSAEPVVRAVAASRIPTIVAIGHEIDVSLSELAADQRASTPSNAAEILVPDRRELQTRLKSEIQRLDSLAISKLDIVEAYRLNMIETIFQLATKLCDDSLASVVYTSRTLDALSPKGILKKGYTIVRRNDKVIKRAAELSSKDKLSLQFIDGEARTTVL